MLKRVSMLLLKKLRYARATHSGGSQKGMLLSQKWHCFDACGFVIVFPAFTRQIDKRTADC